MTDPIFEAAAQCLEEWDSYQHEMMAESVLRVVAPLIRAAALEEAAKVAEERSAERDNDEDVYIEARDIAAAIRPQGAAVIVESRLIATARGVFRAELAKFRHRGHPS
jgi:hypothetical protein